jgi:predicted permease
MVTTPNLFEVLGVNPWLGRGFSPEDAGAGAGRVVVLSYPLWNTLGSDQAIVGRDLRVDGDPFTVIGVMPEGFDFQGHSSLGAPEGADAYLVFDYDLATTNPGAGSFAGLIRAREGTPVPVVEAAVEAVGRAIDERDFQGRGMRFYPVALKPDLVAGVRPALLVVGFAGGFLLLVLLVNLASLLLVRTVERERELAVSRALGANKVALLRATMLEGGVLGLAGGIAGAVAAMWATRVFVSLAPPDFPRLGQVGVDWSVGLTAAGVGLALGLLASSLPAIWATRPALGGLLSAAAVRGGGGHGRARRGMVVVQVALSFVLLTAGGLVVRSFSELLRANPGFDPSGVLTFRVPIADVDSVAQALPRQADIQRELARIPGVTAVGAVGALPFGGGGNQTSITVGGAPGNIGDDDVDHPLIDVFEVLPGYFAAMGIQIVEGRALEFDRPEGLQEALIDEHIARQFFPSGGAIGAEIQLNQSFTTVVGVVRHARYYDVHRDGRPQMFVRNEQAWGSPSLSYVVRSTRSPASLGREVRAAVARVDAQLPVSRLEPLEDIVAGSLSQQRVSAVLIAAFSLGALLLAAMGVFGAVSGSVTRRRQELAVRLAVGADHRRVLRHVVAEGAILVGFGLLVGIPGVYFGGRIIQGVLVGVSPSDPATLLAVAAGLVVIALVACWIPARRVMTIEPASVLRRG